MARQRYSVTPHPIEPRARDATRPEDPLFRRLSKAAPEADDAENQGMVRGGFEMNVLARPWSTYEIGG
jgi:hypothetical protein